MGDCRSCFHYGKNYATGITECAIAERLGLDPLGIGCREYVPADEIVKVRRII